MAISLLSVLCNNGLWEALDDAEHAAFRLVCKEAAQLSLELVQTLMLTLPARPVAPPPPPTPTLAGVPSILKANDLAEWQKCLTCARTLHLTAQIAASHPLGNMTLRDRTLTQQGMLLYLDEYISAAGELGILARISGCILDTPGELLRLPSCELQPLLQAMPRLKHLILQPNVYGGSTDLSAEEHSGAEPSLGPDVLAAVAPSCCGLQTLAWRTPWTVCWGQDAYDEGSATWWALNRLAKVLVKLPQLHTLLVPEVPVTQQLFEELAQSAPLLRVLACDAVTLDSGLEGSSSSSSGGGSCRSSRSSGNGFTAGQSATTGSWHVGTAATASSKQGSDGTHDSASDSGGNNGSGAEDDIARRPRRPEMLSSPDHRQLPSPGLVSPSPMQTSKAAVRLPHLQTLYVGSAAVRAFSACTRQLKHSGILSSPGLPSEATGRPLAGSASPHARCPPVKCILEQGVSARGSSSSVVATAQGCSRILWLHEAAQLLDMCPGLEHLHGVEILCDDIWNLDLASIALQKTTEHLYRSMPFLCIGVAGPGRALDSLMRSHLPGVRHLRLAWSASEDGAASTPTAVQDSYRAPSPAICQGIAAACPGLVRFCLWGSHLFSMSVLNSTKEAVAALAGSLPKLQYIWLYMGTIMQGEAKSAKQTVMVNTAFVNRTGAAGTAAAGAAAADVCTMEPLACDVGSVDVLGTAPGRSLLAAAAGGHALIDLVDHSATSAVASSTPDGSLILQQVTCAAALVSPSAAAAAAAAGHGGEVDDGGCGAVAAASDGAAGNAADSSATICLILQLHARHAAASIAADTDSVVTLPEVRSTGQGVQHDGYASNTNSASSTRPAHSASTATGSGRVVLTEVQEWLIGTAIEVARSRGWTHASMGSMAGNVAAVAVPSFGRAASACVSEGGGEIDDADADMEAASGRDADADTEAASGRDANADIEAASGRGADAVFGSMQPIRVCIGVKMLRAEYVDACNVRIMDLLGHGAPVRIVAW